MSNYRPTLRKADVIALGVLFLIGAALIPAALGRMKEQSARTRCAANVTGTLKGMVVYAADNNDCFPVTLGGESGKYQVNLNDKTLTGGGDGQGEIQEARRGDPTASFWMLVLDNSISTKTLICPSDGFADTPAPTNKAGAGKFLGLQNKSQLSYSLAYPWMVSRAAATEEKGGNALVIPENPGTGKNNGPGVGRWWKNTIDSSLPIMSDMAPFNEPKAKPVIDPAMKNAVEIDVVFDATTQPATQGAGTQAATQVADAGVKATGHTYNSPNHSFVGQNVGFGDAHVEWLASPMLPEKHNIWLAPTKNGEHAISAGDLGPGVTFGSGETGPFKPVMVPARASDGSIK